MGKDIVVVRLYTDIAIEEEDYSRLYLWFERRYVHLVDLIVFFSLWGVSLRSGDRVSCNVRMASLVYPLETHTIINIII